MSAGDPVSAGSVREAETVTESVAESVIDAVPGAHMRREIAQQPACYERLLADRSQVRAVAQALADRDVRFVLIAARGSSDHAALYAKYLVETTLALPCGLVSMSKCSSAARATGESAAFVTATVTAPAARATRAASSRSGEPPDWLIASHNTPAIAGSRAASP